MKKNELKSGMVVEYRDGDKRLVIDNDLIGDDGHLTLTNYNDYLKNGLFSDLDIIKVYKYKSPCPFNALLENNNLDLIWERKESELTDKEIEILNALKVLGYVWLARDRNSELYAFFNEPTKSYSVWDDDNEEERYYFPIKEKDLFNFIKWEDEEPIKIDELLKERK